MKLVSWLWAPITNPGMALIIRLIMLSYLVDSAAIAFRVFVLRH